MLRIYTCISIWLCFRFSVPLSFQQTSRPVPLAYSLDTDFLLTNSEREFSSNPFLAQDGPRVIEFEQVESYTDKDEEFYQSQTVPPMTQDFEQLTFEGEGKFLPDDTIYGRVMWNTGQDLESAYNLQIEKLFLCTGIYKDIIHYSSRSNTVDNIQWRIQ